MCVWCWVSLVQHRTHFILYARNGTQCSLCVDYVWYRKWNFYGFLLCVFLVLLCRTLVAQSPLVSTTRPFLFPVLIMTFRATQTTRALSRLHTWEKNIKTFDRHFSIFPPPLSSYYCHNKIYFLVAPHRNRLPPFSLSYVSPQPEHTTQHTKKKRTHIHEQTLIFIYFIYMLIIIVEEVWRFVKYSNSKKREHTYTQHPYRHRTKKPKSCHQNSKMKLESS